MARMQSGIDADLGIDTSSRGPTGSNFGNVLVDNPSYRWAILVLVASAILVPLVIFFWDTLLSTFGIAMAPVGAMILIGLVVAYLHPGSLWYNANRWLAYVAFGALIFGSMAFFQSDRGVLSESTFGGELGLSIIGDQDYIGVLVLVGIGLGTILLASPRHFRKYGVAGATFIAIGLTLIATCLVLLGRSVGRPLGALKDWQERRKMQHWIGSLSSSKDYSGMGYGITLQREPEPAYEGDSDAMRFAQGATDTLEPAVPLSTPITGVTEEVSTDEEAELEDGEFAPVVPWNVGSDGQEETDSYEVVGQERRAVPPELLWNVGISGVVTADSDEKVGQEQREAPSEVPWNVGINGEGRTDADEVAVQEPEEVSSEAPWNVGGDVQEHTDTDEDVAEEQMEATPELPWNVGSNGVDGTDSDEEVAQEQSEVSPEPALNIVIDGEDQIDSAEEVERGQIELLPKADLATAGNGTEKPDPESELPPIDLLDSVEEVELQPADNEQRADMIKEALASHGIEVTVAQINPGPTVTQFGVEPGWFRKYKEIKERTEEGKIKVDSDGNPVVHREEVSKKRVKVDQVAALDKDLALALAAPSIRIEAPVPGKALVGIEVPNAAMGVVGLKEAIGSPHFQKMLGKSKLALALGQGSSGEVVADSLARMPHLLIAGATGSGKSVAITSIISCLLMHNTPEDLRFVLIDPKRVELVGFSTIPHLMTPVIVDMEKVVDTLKWVCKEMDRRYKVMASAAARNIESYNKKVDPSQKMSFLVVVIDELADLMAMSPFDVEQALTRLAQMGRATGIHLVVATQRPSVDVITGLIKANFPTRLSFAVTSMMDSRVILDTGGAEKLLGRGDMLYLPSDASKPRRLQGVYLSDQEVDRLVYHWTEQRGQLELPIAADEITESSETPTQVRDEDPMANKARDLAMGLKSISTSLLQRRLGIGYPRAAKLIDILEEQGIVSEGEPGKSRKVIKEPQTADSYLDD